MLFSLAIVFKSFSPLSSSMTNSDLNFAEKILLVRDIKMILHFYSAYSIPDSLKYVSQSVLNYDTIIVIGFHDKRMSK